MNYQEAKSSVQYNQLPDSCYNLYIHPVGAHHVEFFTKIGRGLAEKKITRVGRMAIGKQDMELLSAIKDCDYDYSKTGKSCYLVNANELQRDIVNLLLNQ